MRCGSSREPKTEIREPKKQKQKLLIEASKSDRTRITPMTLINTDKNRSRAKAVVRCTVDSEWKKIKQKHTLDSCPPTAADFRRSNI